MLSFDPPINVVDFNTAEGLARVDEHSLIISIDTIGTVIEPALDLTRDEGGPAGILNYAWTKRAEEEWNGKVLGAGETVGHNLGWGSVTEWEY